MTSTLPERAADFIDAIGVNTHLDQNGNNVPTILADMAYLGLTHVRNASLSGLSSRFVVRDAGALAAAGIQFDFFARAAIPGTISALDAFATLYPNAVSAIEGPNEVNNFPFSYQNLSGAAAAVAYENDLYAAAKADPALAAVPVLNFTNSPYTPAAADASNFHPYFGQGAQPLATLAMDYAKAQKFAPGLPVYFTETGYPSAPLAANGQGVDTLTQAKQTLNLIMDAAKLGVAAAYLYNLMDDGTDPTAAMQNFGLFTAGGVAKPVAVAIHNLTTILADTGASAGGFRPTALNYTLAGLPTNGSSVLIEKSNGVYDLVIWAEPTIWNPVTHTRIAAPVTPVTVDLGATFRNVTVLDPLSSVASIKSAANARSVTINLTDHPLIIQVSNLAAAISAMAPDPAAGTAAPIGAQSQPPVVALMATPAFNAH